MSAIKFIQDGGFFMYPILLIMFVGLGVAIERIMFLNRIKNANKMLWDDVYPSIQNALGRRISIYSKRRYRKSP